MKGLRAGWGGCIISVHCYVIMSVLFHTAMVLSPEGMWSNQALASLI